jgi:outer membrane protein OmpA-like peptidoglycan-associated protein
MVSKKYFSLMIVLLVLTQTVSFGQAATDLSTNWGWNWLDSSKIAPAKMPQYNAFASNEFPYPARPRDQWELGVGAGTAILSNTWGQDFGFGATITLRKALNHTFSLRPYLAYYMNTGGGNDISGNQLKYKDNSFHIGMDVLTSLNSLSFYRGNPKTNIYLITGFDYYAPTIKQSINGGAYNSFTNPSNNSALDNFGLNVGLGAAFKISPRVNLALEAKNTLTNNAYLNSYSSQFSRANDAWWYAGVKLNFNLGNASKRVEPLYWINPNSYAYSELNAPKHMKMPKIVLPDADGDGVTDQFDLEPNTPAGVKVDTHGRALDTDGDGVPDYKDKELLTPQKCFPVNADGVGTCPEPACCQELRGLLANYHPAPACTLTDLPSITFKKGAKLSTDATKLLDAAAAKIKANPDCKVKVVGHPTASKAAQQLSYDRVESVIKYLVDKQGISESRFIFSYDGGAGDANTIDLLGTLEDGPNTVPAPHPNLKSGK